jgi:hypothetical protein
MLSTKTRTSIIALVAAFSVATAVGPSVSQATRNTGAYSKSAEAKEKQEQAFWCHQMLGMFNEDLQTLGNAHASGDQAAINQARKEVNADYQMGYDAGCAWASRVRPPESPTSGLVPPVGGIMAPPEGGPSPLVRGTTASTPSPATK